MEKVKAAVVALAFVAAFLVAIAVGWMTSARAQDGWMERSLISSCEWHSGRPCRVRPVKRKRTYYARERAPVRYIERREPVYRDYRERLPERRGRFITPDCKPLVEGVSGEHTVKGPEDEAKRRWAGIVRMKYGEMYMDLSHAAGAELWCHKSSTDERFSERYGPDHQRCRFIARPCFSATKKE